MLERVRKGLSAAAALTALSLALLLGWAPEASSQLKAVAKVNGAVLTERDLGEAFNKIIPAAIFHGGISPERRQAYRDKAVEQMINDELLYQEAVRMGLKVSRRRIKEARQDAVERLGGKKRFKQALETHGITQDEYEQMLRKKFLIEEILEAEVSQKAEVTDEEAREYYGRNKSGFMRPEAWRLRHILISVDPSAPPEEWEARRKRAEEALEKIKGGEDMAQVAWDYSDDRYRVKGGDLGLIHSGRLVADLEAAVRELEVGELSGVVQTIYGYHIVRVEEKKEPEQLSYEEVEDKIKRQLSAKRSEQNRKNLIERLRAEAEIEVY